MNKLTKKLLSGLISVSMLLAAVPALVSADELPSDGLLFNATFDEAGTGSGSFTATAGGTVTEKGAVSYVDSWDGNSKALNIASKAAGNYLELADGLLQGKQAATFAFWLKADSPSAPNWPFMNTCETSHTVNTEKYIGMLATSESFTVERYNNTDSRLSSVTAPSTADWQYVVAVYDTNGTKLYSNGKLIASDSVTVDVPALFTATSKTWIGHANWGDGEGFQGSIDDFRIYGKALNDSEIAALSADGAKYEKDKFISDNNCFISGSRFYLGNDEIFSYDGTSPYTSSVYLASEPKYADGNASFSLINASAENVKDLTAYVAEYSSNKLVNVKNIKLTDATAAQNGTYTVPYTKTADANTVKTFVWNNMKPVPQFALTVKSTVNNYTANDGNVKTELYCVNADGTETKIGESAEAALASAESGDFNIVVSADALADIPETASKLKVKLISDGEAYDDAAALYMGIKSPVAAPADSGTTTDGAHDPSIVKFPNDDTYYVYSSHHLLFTSEDLINWKKYDFTNINASAISPKTNAFISSNYSGTTMNGTYWAPDVIYREDDDHPYWMYISLSCGLGGRNSAIALEKSDSPLFWADPEADIIDAGVVFATKENNNYKTNAIDANIYTDSNTGKQYFVWGSFWGGIQAAPLTADGLVEGIDYTSDATILSTCQNFGTSIFTQKNGVAGPEGAWMIEHDGNRYAFTSYGWLGSNYNTRVAKSALTTGFSTSNGWNLTDASGVTMNNQQSAGSTSKTTGYKMIGSYRLGDGSRTIALTSNNYAVQSGAGDAIVYYGPGHNSAINVGGESFYVSHTKKNAVEIAATLQIRKMLWTADGWPVVSPVTYAGEVEQALPKDMIVGTYDLASVGQTKMIGSSIQSSGSLVNRNYDLPVLSSKVTLGDDMKMTNEAGSEIGTWAFDNDHTVTLTFTANGDTSDNKDEFYKSGDVMTMYALFGYDKDERTPVVGLTGTDQNHVTQLAKKAVSNEYRTPINTIETTPVEVTKSSGGNPIIRADGDGNIVFTGDPAATVIDTDNDGEGDTVYLIVGHDNSTDTVEDPDDDYSMPDWLVYSSTDMKEWAYKGIAMSSDKQSITWAKTGHSAWASQMVPHNGKYYLYFCTWDSTSGGRQSIGVAVADKPEGPYKDKGTPLIKGDLTTPQTSDWNDIDPTVWIEEDADGNEHRYLAWGNGKFYICELNDDMTSVKNLGGDDTIEMGTDIKEQTFNSLPGGQGFTEAPWIYRRTGADGKYTGKYYMFGAFGWREQMGYVTSDSIDGPWEAGGIIMPPTATSNTNHPSVIDFKGKTYFIYHNGALPSGFGHRRSVCVEEFTFNDDGTIDPIQETSTGLAGTKSYIYNDDGFINYGNFVNSGADGDYPITRPMYVGGQVTDIKDTQWEIVPGKADESNANYVSIQAVNKPGLYITASGNNVVLTQDSNRNDTAMKKNMTFKAVKRVDAEGDMILFESVAKPGYYLTDNDGSLTLGKGTDFQISDTAPEIENLASIENAWYADGKVHFNLLNAAIYGKVDIQIAEQSGDDEIEKNITASIDADSLNESVEIEYTRQNSDAQMFILAYFGDKVAALPVEITQFENPYQVPTGFTSHYDFEENLTDSVTSTTTAAIVPTNIEGTTTASASYADGYKGKAVSFSGAGGTGVNLGKVITNSKYTAAFWMKATTFTQHTSGVFINSGTGSSENWLSAPFGWQQSGNTMIWSKNGETYKDVVGGSIDDAWHYITITVDGTTAALYIDGVKAASGEVNNTVSDSTDTYLGVNFWDTPFNGLIDDLYIYNGTTLTDAQVTNLFEATK